MRQIRYFNIFSPGKLLSYGKQMNEKERLSKIEITFILRIF